MTDENGIEHKECQCCPAIFVTLIAVGFVAAGLWAAHAVGHDFGYLEGYRKGADEGYQRGIAEGYQRGQAGEPRPK